MDPHTTKQRINLLLVEDNQVDVWLIKRIFSNSDLPIDLVNVRNGKDALEYLRSSNTTRQIIITDLEMPELGGLELLRELRDDPKLCDKIVFVLSRSTNLEDRKRAYQHQAAGYLVKQEMGHRFEGLRDIMQNYLKYVKLTA